MGGVDPLVPEDSAYLVDLVHAADDEALEVELGGDAEVDLAVERVVAGDEWLGHRSGGHGHEHGRVHFQEAARVEEGADGGDDAAAGAHRLVHLAVGDEVQVALAVALLDVAQAVELLGRRTERLGQQREALHGERHLSHLRADQRAGRARKVAEVEVFQQGVAVADGVAADEQLQASLRVLDVCEGGLSHAAQAHDAPGNGGRGAVGPSGFGIGEGARSLSRRVGPVEAGRVGVDVAPAQPFQLGAAARQQLVSALGHGRLRLCGPRSTERRRQ